MKVYLVFQLLILFFVLPSTTIGQFTFVPLGSEENHLIDRIDIKQQQNLDFYYTGIKPYNRKSIVQFLECIDSATSGPVNAGPYAADLSRIHPVSLTNVDEYNIQHFEINNSEWLVNDHEALSTNSSSGSFYKYKGNMLQWNNTKSFVAINPLLESSVGSDLNNKQSTYLQSFGLETHGKIADALGFSGSITYTNEKGPAFFQNKVLQIHAVPGVGFYRSQLPGTVSYLDPRGYITLSPVKYIALQAGYDKNFLGNGYRSMFLSDWGNSYFFVKIDTRIWRFKYENLFMRLTPQFSTPGLPVQKQKYAVMHTLSMDVNKTMNIGLFEGIIFARSDHFDFQYLNPVIFLRHIEGTVGSPDNANVGIDYKWNLFRRVQFYSQFLLDEFVVAHFFKHDGYWDNKWAFQNGVKYVDAFGINNLDLQLEVNLVRPFTYSHGDTLNNYTHYNQPLADPLGANFHEVIGILNYQPANKWRLNMRAIYYDQGLDSAGQNFGSNPFENYFTRTRDLGYKISGGQRMKCLNGSMLLSYEAKQNLYVDASFLYRRSVVQNTAAVNSSIISVGVRLNMNKRQYDY